MEYNRNKLTASGWLSSLSISSVDHFRRPPALPLKVEARWMEFSTTVDKDEMFVKMSSSVSYTKTDMDSPCDQAYDSLLVPYYTCLFLP